MFPRSLRLSRAGFDQSRKLSRKTTAHFSISYGAGIVAAGIGVIVPKKAVRSAVDRHRLKRRIREIVRTCVKQGGFPDIVVISARTGSSELSFQAITDELSGAFRAILLETNSAS